MPETTTIIFDNFLSSQNQDYLPSRILLQKEIIDEMITRILEANPENLIGLFPLSQNQKNDILTPTKSRPHLSTFLHTADLNSHIDHSLTLFQAEVALTSSEFSSKNLVIFFSSPANKFEEIIVNLYNILSRGINVRLICFGDAIELGNFLEKEIKFENFSLIYVNEEDDFNSVVSNFLETSFEIDDPELQEAIKRSLKN